jgi:hypothetical protein
MKSGGFRHDLYQMVTAPDFGFYQMMPHDHLTDGTGQPLSEAEHGNYKFHLSIDTADVPRAWDIVSNKLMNHTHAHIAKVTKPDTSERFNNPDSIQAGKHITIYTFKDISPEVYKSLIQDIETELSDNGIKPGAQSNADRIIPGGKYTGYRSDKDNNGEYIGSSDIRHLPRERRHNPFNQADPYKNFEIRHQDQRLENKIHQNPKQPTKETTEEKGFLKRIGDTVKGLAKKGFQRAAPQGPQPKVTQNVAHEKSLRKNDWVTVTDRSGQSAQYFILDGKSNAQQAMMHEALSGAGIDYHQKQSSINGGCTVLSVSGRDNIQKLNSLMNPNAKPSSPKPSDRSGGMGGMSGGMGF